MCDDDRSKYRYVDAHMNTFDLMRDMAALEDYLQICVTMTERNIIKGNPHGRISRCCCIERTVG